MTTQEPSQIKDAASTPALLSRTHQVRLAITAPTGRSWTALALAYLLGLIFSAGLPVFLFALMSKPINHHDEDGDHFIAGRQALWLWVVGIVLSATTMARAPFLKPEHLSLLDWFQASPWAAGSAVLAALAALALGLWHMTWIVPRR